MNRQRSMLTAIPALALVLPLLVAGVTPAPDTSIRQPAVVHDELASALASAAAGDRLQVTVSAWDRAGLRGALADLGIDAHELRTVPIAIASLTRAQLGVLAADERVRSLWGEVTYELALETSTAMVGADQAAERWGVDGTRPAEAADGDVVVAVIDTGIDTTHPDLDGDKVLANYEVVDAAPAQFQLIESPDTDDHGHGTHVASTIAGLDDDGDRSMDGVAPGANLLGYSINANNTVSQTRALVAFDDAIAKREDGVNVVALSNSWGGGEGDHAPWAPLSIITKRAHDAGIAVVFAAGNAGDALDTASDECTMPYSICVGALTKGRTLAGFSSRGRPPVPVSGVRPDGVAYDYRPGNHDRDLGQALDIGVFRPTVSAPGVDILAACAQSVCGPTGDYQLMSGTSMATPHVSGVIALIAAARQQAVGSYDLSTEEVTDLLEATSTPLPGYDLWEVGSGEANALEAVKLALSGDALAIPSPNLGGTGSFVGDADAAESLAVDVVLPNGWQTGVGNATGTFEVPPGTGRLHTLLTWPAEEGNIYLRLYEPGATSATAESTGLLDGETPYLRGYRELSVYFPTPGTWTYEVMGRANVPVTEATLTVSRWNAGQPVLTVTDGQVDVELPTDRPDAGVSRVAVAGTDLPLEVESTPTDHWLHSYAGNSTSPGTLLFDGQLVDPWLDTTPPSLAAPKTSEVTMVANAAYAGNFLTAYWRSSIDAVLAGDATLTLHASAPAGSSPGTPLIATLFSVAAGYEGAGEATIIGSGVASVPAEPGIHEVEIPVAGVLADLRGDRELVVQLTSTFIDSDHVQIWHDSTEFPSRITLPVLDGPPPTAAPAGVTVTDLVEGARIAWPHADGVDSYTVYASGDPRVIGAPVATVDAAAGHVDVPATDVTYLRVTSVTDGIESVPTGVLVGFPLIDGIVVEHREPGGAWERLALDSGDDRPGKGKGRGKGRGKGIGNGASSRSYRAGEIRALDVDPSATFVPPGDLRARTWEAVSSTVAWGGGNLTAA